MAGKLVEISFRIWMVMPARAMRKTPLGVLGRILIRSVGVVWSVRFRRRLSERRSVRLSVFPMGTEFRAFLTQKTNMMGQAVKPIKIQPIDSCMTRRARPQKNNAAAIK